MEEIHIINYKTDDGKIFENKLEAVKHEKSLYDQILLQEKIEAYNKTNNLSINTDDVSKFIIDETDFILKLISPLENKVEETTEVKSEETDTKVEEKPKEVINETPKVEDKPVAFEGTPMNFQFNPEFDSSSSEIGAPVVLETASNNS